MKKDDTSSCVVIMEKYGKRAGVHAKRALNIDNEASSDIIKKVAVCRHERMQTGYITGAFRIMHAQNERYCAGGRQIAGRPYTIVCTVWRADKTQKKRKCRTVGRRKRPQDRRAELCLRQRNAKRKRKMKTYMAAYFAQQARKQTWRDSWSCSARA